MTTPSINLRLLATLLWSRRLTLAGFVLAASILSAIYALTRPVLYESDAELAQVKDDTSQLGGALGNIAGQLGGLVGGLGLPGGSTTVEESVEVLKSREFALRFMDEHGVLQFLFPTKWDQAAGKWKPEANADGSSWATPLAQWLSSTPPIKPAPRPPGPSPDLAVKSFDDIRVANIDRRTNFVKLSVRGPSPEIARSWAAAMIEELNESLRRRALEDSHRAIALLSNKVDTDPQQSTRMIASALLESQLRREVSAESRREFALRVLDPPSLPDQRYSPKRSRMVMIGAALGFLLGAIYVLGMSAWRQRRRGRSAAPVRGATA